MKTTPARKNSRSATRTAATTHRTKPVSEMAFGVRRDSIRRLRTSSRRSREEGDVDIWRGLLGRGLDGREGPRLRALLREPLGSVEAQRRGRRAEDRVHDPVV